MTTVVLATEPTDKMLTVLRHVRDNPGQPKMSAAMSLVPPTGLRYAYTVVSRCFELGLLAGRRVSQGYQVDLTDTGRRVLEAYGYRSWS